MSGKNPNVLFELGLRLAFDKPTLIVKDDKTSYSFDTSAIEHLDYPRDLRFSRIVDFKQKLSAKIKATIQKSTSDPSYTTFLKHFGEFTVAKLEQKEITGQEYILEEIRGVRSAMMRLESAQSDRPMRMRDRLRSKIDDTSLDLCLADKSPSEISEMVERIRASMVVNEPQVVKRGTHMHLTGKMLGGLSGKDADSIFGFSPGATHD